jgi:hypothetical protein
MKKDHKQELYQQVANIIGEMSFVDIDLLVDALFAKSETLPYTFNRAIHCNLKKREEIARNEVLNMSR